MFWISARDDIRYREATSIGEKYIANDVVLDSSSQQIIIITGPNMAGKVCIAETDGVDNATGADWQLRTCRESAISVW